MCNIRYFTPQPPPPPTKKKKVILTSCAHSQNHSSTTLGSPAKPTFAKSRPSRSPGGGGRGGVAFCCCCLFCCRSGGVFFVLLLLPGGCFVFAVWAPTGSSLTCWFAGASAAEHSNKNLQQLPTKFWCQSWVQSLGRSCAAQADYAQNAEKACACVRVCVCVFKASGFCVLRFSS